MSAMVRKPCRCASGAASFPPCQNGGIGFLHHLLAEVHADQVVLENIVVEHILGGFAEIHDPLAHRRRPHTERHVLRVGRAGSVVIPADPADAAGDEVRVPRILPFHENAVSAEDGRRAMTFGDLAIVEINLRENSQAADDPGNGIPIHVHQFPRTGRCAFCRSGHRSHNFPLL